MDILVFKTDVSEQTQIHKVNILLKTIFGANRWSFDLEDCDHILRILANNLSPRRVESVLQTAGFVCKELE